MAKYFGNFGMFDPSMGNFWAGRKASQDEADRIGRGFGQIGGTLLTGYNKLKADELYKNIMDAWDYEHDSEIPDPEFDALTGKDVNEDIVLDFPTMFDKEELPSLDDLDGSASELSTMGETAGPDGVTVKADGLSASDNELMDELNAQTLLEPDFTVEEDVADLERLKQRRQDLINANSEDFDASDQLDEVNQAIAELEAETSYLDETQEDPNQLDELDRMEVDLGLAGPSGVVKGEPMSKFISPEDEETYKRMRGIFKHGMSDEDKYRRAAALLAPYDSELANQMTKYADERSALERQLIEKEKRASEKKKTEDKFIKREESYNNFAIARDEYINAVQSYQRGDISIDELNESFRNAEAAKSKALGTGVPTSNLGLKSPLDFARQGDKDKLETSKLAQGAVKLVNDRVNTAKNDGKEFIKKYTEVKKSKTIISKLKQKVEKGTVSPKELFAAVKQLSNVIEPGLSVTEGEVSAYLGETDASQFIINASAWTGLLENLKGKGGEATKRKVSKAEVLDILKLADELSNGVINTYRNAAIGQRDKLIKDIRNDIDVSYNGVLDEDRYDKLFSEVGNKYDAAFGLGNITIDNKNKGAKGSKKRKAGW